MSVFVRAPALRGNNLIAWWTLASAVLAPLSLVTAWVVAGYVQRGDYNALQQTISVLAGHAASHRWIMTMGLYLLGACQILTAAGLSTEHPLSRIVLAVGGLTGLGVASFPQPPHGTTAIHLVFATLSVSLLAVWPVTIGSRGSTRPLVLTVRGSVVATVVFLGLLAWLFTAAHGGGALGAAERIDTAVTSSWPLVVVVAIRRAGARSNSFAQSGAKDVRSLRRNATATINGQQTCSAELIRSATPSAVPLRASIAVQTNNAVEATTAAIVRCGPTAARTDP